MAVLSTHGISKRFPGVLANDSIDLELRHGEIHALIGENGAGKTTLASILAGFFSSDAGEVRLEGRPLGRLNPARAMAAGVALVQQHVNLVPSFSVLQNMALPGRWLSALDVAELGRRAAALASESASACVRPFSV